MESNATEVKTDAQVIEKKEPVAVKAGMPIAAEFKSTQPQILQPGETGNMGGGAAAAPAAAAPAATVVAPAAGAEGAAAEPTDEEKLKEILKKAGVDYTGSLDDLKAKIAAPAPGKEPTEEEKKLSESILEQRMVAKFVTEGGTIDQYAAMKQVANMDAKELSQASTTKELKEAGFDDAEIEDIIKKRYYQIKEDLVRDEDNETVEQFDARKKRFEKEATFFGKKFEGKSSHIKTDAANFINNLREAVKSEDSQKAKEATFLSNVDESLKKLPRELTLELGLVNDQKIDPVPFKVLDEHIASVKGILNDPATRKQYFINADISQEDLGRAINIILRNVAFESAARVALLEGGTREVAKFKKIFPDNPNTIGVGGAPKKNDSKIVKAGDPVYMQPKGVTQ